jgi:meso-butanediol dehydrogenase / (S,S)-butanediol dehydrogenase / diacetyl reductase
MSEVSRLLEGRRALVTGAAGGIGRAVVARFAEAGASVVPADLVEERAFVRIDVRDEASVVAAFDTAENEGPLTDVVHCAGIARPERIRELTLADWNAILETNLTGSFLVGRESARRLRRGGTLTFLSSQGGLRADAMWAAYGASKFGVIALTQAIGRELATDGIRVNAVCPGGVRTPMSDATIELEASRDGLSVDEKRSQHDARVPLGRMAEPEEVADVCLFLASPLSRHVAAAALVVNGAQ